MLKSQQDTTIERTMLLLGTIVTIKVESKEVSAAVIEQTLDRAFAKMQQVELACSRFDEKSELRRVCNRVGVPTLCSEYLYEPLRFALMMSEITDGVFDPTVGRVMYANGFSEHYLTGTKVHDETANPGDVTYKDVVLDDTQRTILLKRPLTLDLGAVAKGFAVDLAVKELNGFESFWIDAGGDVFVGSHHLDGTPWHVAVRHPVQTDKILCTLQAAQVAICTSGGYERRNRIEPENHHLIHPITGKSPDHVISSTVIAPFAMMADAFSTAAFVLGIEDAKKLLQTADLEGLLVDNELECHRTSGLGRYF